MWVVDPTKFSGKPKKNLRRCECSPMIYDHNVLFNIMYTTKSTVVATRDATTTVVVVLWNYPGKQTCFFVCVNARITNEVNHATNYLFIFYIYVCTLLAMVVVRDKKRKA